MAKEGCSCNEGVKGYFVKPKPLTQQQFEWAVNCADQRARAELGPLAQNFQLLAEARARHMPACQKEARKKTFPGFVEPKPLTPYQARWAQDCAEAKARAELGAAVNVPVIGPQQLAQKTLQYLPECQAEARKRGAGPGFVSKDLQPNTKGADMKGNQAQALYNAMTNLSPNIGVDPGESALAAAAVKKGTLDMDKIIQNLRVFSTCPSEVTPPEDELRWKTSRHSAGGIQIAGADLFTGILNTLFNNSVTDAFAIIDSEQDINLDPGLLGDRLKDRVVQGFRVRLFISAHPSAAAAAPEFNTEQVVRELRQAVGMLRFRIRRRNSKTTILHAEETIADAIGSFKMLPKPVVFDEDTLMEFAFHDLDRDNNITAPKIVVPVESEIYVHAEVDFMFADLDTFKPMLKIPGLKIPVLDPGKKIKD